MPRPAWRRAGSAHCSGSMARLPVELVSEVLAIYVWDWAHLRKAWLCSLATTSRFVWLIVKPALYNTVLLSKSRTPRVLSCAGSGHFALTRRLWCTIPDVVNQSTEMARIFPGVRHFAGSEALLYRLYDEPGTSFRPVQVTLILGTLTSPWRPLHSLRHITHLHLIFETYSLVGDLIGTLDGARALKYVLLSSLRHDTPLGWLIHRILPFFFACRSLERVVVRVSPDPEIYRLTVFGLQTYANRWGEKRLWTCVERANTDTSYPGAVTIAEDKWLDGERIEVGPLKQA